MSTALTLEQKRERNRATVKRFYYKRIATLRQLREEADALDRQYRHLVAIIQQHQAIPDQESDESTKYVELAHVKDALAQENQKLREMVNKQMRLRQRLERIVLLHDEDDSDLDDLDDDQLHLNGAVPPPSRTIKLPFISVEDCDRIVQRSMDRIQAVTPLMLAETTVLAEWQCDYRTDSDQHLHYTCRKTFAKASISAQEIAQRTWKMWVLPTYCQRLFTSALQTRTQLLKRINGHHAIMSRSLEREGVPTVVKTVFLLSVVPIERNGWAVVFSGVQDAQFMQQTDFQISLSSINKQDQWVDMLYWTRVYPKPDGSCDVESGGVIPPYLGLNARFWTIESLLMVSLWETQVLEFGTAWLPPAQQP